MTNAKRLSRAILDGGRRPRHQRLAARAETGEFTDSDTPHLNPTSKLRELCIAIGLYDLADRVATGEFEQPQETNDG